MKRRQLKRQQRSSCTGSTASGWEKSFPTSFLSLPPRLSESRSDCVPGRSSPALLSGCRGSVASPWQPPPVDIPAAPAGRARLRWTAWSAHSPCSRTATDTKTQKPLLSRSTGTFYLLTEYTFTDALINQFIFTFKHLCWPLGKNNASHETHKLLIWLHRASYCNYGHFCPCRVLE